ncbi:uncharacterized protein TRAVEDRAFT_51227 [Trametes versicolor FP-101664 SS1]|uniref:uncharacterized protein n=1 Tax=Trametes versicolor (strain FP-101664) TaxID=717944 RepID=UPI00046237D2|nr:uncharacterized protein TRAVEDRAFT_51227 [Trametes versicolor FP-101664 SS1]EIW55101.1 hypothetical protein TRAVEDRAFT_51227 [Trametes versicolor FP-101664 SS1]
MSSTGSGVADGLPASPSYPRTRSQTTRPQPVLKRKGSDITRAKPQKAAKITGAGPSLSATPSVDTSPEAAVESPVDVPAAATARTLWPPEVPRSMLFTFRVGPSAFQMYDGVKRRSALDVSSASDTSQFAATGSEPMFDNSWRVSFIESAHSPPQRTNIAPPSEQRRIHDSSRRFATNEGPQAQVVDHDLSRLEAAVDSRTMGPSHKCPFCPRTFPLANGLTIHLKWHWGASGLEWKRGISRTGKTIDRALRDAERRREEAARQQDELDFPGIPPSISTSCSPPRASSSSQSSTRLSNQEMDYSFTMPVMAQSTFNTFGFPVYSSRSSTASESPYPSPIEGQYPHMFQPPVVAAPNMSYNSFPHTPELLADTGSTNSASTGRSSPTWSENLFGYGEEDAEGDSDHDDDLFGDHPDPRCEAASCATGNAASAGSAVRTSVCICRRERSVAAVACRGGNVGGGGGRRRAVSVRVRPLFLRAPRLAPLRLPAAFFDDDDDDGGEDGASRVSTGENGGEDDDDPFAMRGFSAPSDGLAPLHGLPPLQALPELDAAFQNLFVF